MSIIRAVPGLFYIIIAVATIIIFMMLMWQHVPQKCYEELNGTSVRVTDNLEKCADMCWRKHDFGSDLENDDCYIINVFVQDGNISKQDFENDNLHVYFDRIESGKQYKIKIRYNATGPEISLILLDVTETTIQPTTTLPIPTTTIYEKTCEEKCIELGWASGKCKTSALTSKILNPCSKTEKNIGYTLDCKPEKSDVVGVTKACCCIQALPE